MRTCYLKAVSGNEHLEGAKFSVLWVVAPVKPPVRLNLASTISPNGELVQIAKWDEAMMKNISCSAVFRNRRKTAENCAFIEGKRLTGR